jgi:tetratricopeptide (TPR) repeat protein
VTITDQSEPREERARRLLAAARYADAVDEIAMELRERPRDIDLRLLASDACERLGALPEAADHLSSILSAEPEHPAANRRLAELLGELGDTHGAIRCLRRFVSATHEKDSDAVALLAIALSKDGQHDSAIELLAKLTHRHPSDGSALANLGMAFFAAEREDDALTAWTRVLALDPQSAQAHCGFGLTHQMHGRLEEAAAAFRAAERLAPDSVVGSFNLGLVLERLGDLDGARRALLRAAALEPHDEEIQRALEPLLVRPAPASQSSADGGASIKGELASFDLLDVLEFLRMQEKTGSLVVSAPAGVAMLHLEKGMLVGGSAPGLERLGETLVSGGVISPENLQFALSRQRDLYPGIQVGVDQDATILGALLLRERLLDEEQLASVLFRMILHVIGQIRQWREGAFAFHSSADRGFPVRFHIQEVVMDMLRLEDERNRSE